MEETKKAIAEIEEKRAELMSRQKLERIIPQKSIAEQLTPDYAKQRVDQREKARDKLREQIMDQIMTKKMSDQHKKNPLNSGKKYIYIYDIYNLVQHWTYLGLMTGTRAQLERHIVNIYFTK